MKLLTKAAKTKLLANAAFAASGGDTSEIKPVVKFFGGSACTWLASEMDEDGMMFGLADLGFGAPEMGYFDIAELESIKFPPFNLGIERDINFKAKVSLSKYADMARGNGGLMGIA